ncbi:hypothetical protein [Dietzia aurantiaca]|uniref:Porin n=1 Tax=Dietzia aurantiaca TaxID=983873 RepID=A0ABV9PSU0_9ACTN
MARLWVRPSRLAALGIAAATAVAVAPIASAQLPGVDNNTQVFPVDDERILIAVDEPDLEAGTVGVTVQNNTAQALACTGIDGGQAGAVTTAEVAAKSVDFYARFPNSTLSPIDVEVDVPGAIAGSVGDLGDGFQIDLGSITGMIPGSAAGLVNEEWGALGEISGDFTQSRLNGQYGAMGASLSIPALTAQPYTVELGQTSRGERPAFQAAVVLTCVLGGQRYIFHGYNGDAPVLETSTGSLSGGSLGS